jgi:hypothetical protein
LRRQPSPLWTQAQPSKQAQAEANVRNNSRQTVAKAGSQRAQATKQSPTTGDVTDTTLKPQHCLALISAHKHLWFDFPPKKYWCFGT